LIVISYSGGLESTSNPTDSKGENQCFAPLTIRVLAGCWQTSQNKRKSADTVSAENV